MKKLLLPFAILASAACGDTYNNYVMDQDEDPETGVEINDCNDVAARLYECNPQRYEDYKAAWDVSIEKQMKHIVRECSPEKVDFFERAPLWIDCISQKSCEFIKAGNCDHYMVDY